MSPLPYIPPPPSHNPNEPGDPPARDTLPESLPAPDYARIGFHHALGLSGAEPTAPLDHLIKEAVAPLEEQMQAKEAYHTARVQTVRGKVDDLDKEHAQYRALLDQPAEPEDEAISKVKEAEANCKQVQHTVSAERLKLAHMRQDLQGQAIQVYFKQLDTTMGIVQGVAQKQYALAESANEHQKDRIQLKRSFLSTRLDHINERLKRVSHETLTEGMTFGSHRFAKLALAGIIAAILGWALAILIGSTKFDDNMIFELFLKDIIKNIGAWVAQESIWTRLLFFIALALAYILLLAFMVFIHGIMAKAKVLPAGEIDPISGKVAKIPDDSQQADPQAQKRQAESPTEKADTEEVQQAKAQRRNASLYDDDSETDLPLDPDNAHSSMQVGAILIYGMAPLWLLGAFMVCFAGPIDQNAVDTTENSYSGFFIGYIASWMLAMMGYYFQRPAQGWRPPLILSTAAAISTGAAITLLARYAFQASTEQAFAAGITALMLGISATFSGRIIREYFLITEERGLTQFAAELNRRLSNIASPWASDIHYKATNMLRTRFNRFSDQLNNIQNDLLYAVSGKDRKQWEGENEARTPEKAPLNEYHPLDQHIFPQQVSIIEANKRELNLAQGQLNGTRQHLVNLRSATLDWQQALRDNIQRIHNQRQQLAKDIQDLEQAHAQERLQAKQQIARIAAELRKGYLIGTWYRQRIPQPVPPTQDPKP